MSKKEKFYTNNNKPIIYTEEEYFSHFENSLLNNKGCFLNSKNNSEKYKSLIKAFEIALDTRKFEIEMYWKRATYFWAFIAALFVAWYNVQDDRDHFVTFLIIWLGFSVSLCWFYVNKGSKFWQKNWEDNIDYLSQKLGVPVFAMISFCQESPYSIQKEYPYSVSKVNQIVSFITVLLWIFLGFREMFKLTVFPLCCFLLCLLLALNIIGGTFVLLHFLSKGFASKEMKDATNKIKGEMPPMFRN